MVARVKVYDRCKYDKESKKVGELLYEIICFKVEYRDDDDDDYFILYLTYGETATFYNSYVDLFIL